MIVFISTKEQISDYKYLIYISNNSEFDILNNNWNGQKFVQKTNLWSSCMFLLIISFILLKISYYCRESTGLCLQYIFLFRSLKAHGFFQVVLFMYYLQNNATILTIILNDSCFEWTSHNNDVTFF